MPKREVINGQEVPSLKDIWGPCARELEDGSMIKVGGGLAEKIQTSKGRLDRTTLYSDGSTKPGPRGSGLQVIKSHSVGLSDTDAPGVPREG